MSMESMEWGRELEGGAVGVVVDVGVGDLAEVEPVSKSVPSFSDVDVYPEKRVSLLHLLQHREVAGGRIKHCFLTGNGQELRRMLSPITSSPMETSDGGDDDMGFALFD